MSFGGRFLFFNTVYQSIVSCMQCFFDRLELRCLDVLCAALYFYKALSRHVASVNLEHTNKIRLSQLLCLSDFSYVLANVKILLDFLLHNITPSGLNLVQLGLFYEFTMI